MDHRQFIAELATLLAKHGATELAASDYDQNLAVFDGNQRLLEFSAVYGNGTWKEMN